VTLLFNQLVQICLFKTKPQDLAYSHSAVWILLILECLILLSAPLDISKKTLLGAVIISILMDAAVVFLALRALEQINRFNQTLIAVLGINVVLTAIANLLILLMNWSQLPIWDTLLAIMLFLTIFWSIVVYGHIYQHAFQMSIKEGSSIAFLVFVVKTFFSNAVLG
jgi:hypothetical protein